MSDLKFKFKKIINSNIIKYVISLVVLITFDIAIYYNTTNSYIKIVSLMIFFIIGFIISLFNLYIKRLKNISINFSYNLSDKLYNANKDDYKNKKELCNDILCNYTEEYFKSIGLYDNIGILIDVLYVSKKYTFKVIKKYLEE